MKLRYMEKDNKVFLEHILESIEFIENYTSGLTESDFLIQRKSKIRPSGGWK